MSGVALINPNLDRNGFFNNQPGKSQHHSLEMLVGSKSDQNVSEYQRNNNNFASNTRRQFGQKQNNDNRNFGSQKHNNNSYNNFSNQNVSSQQHQKQQNVNQDQQSSTYQKENRKTSPYCRNRQTSDEYQASETLNKTKAIQKQCKTLKLSKKFNLNDNSECELLPKQIQQSQQQHYTHTPQISYTSSIPQLKTSLREVFV